MTLTCAMGLALEDIPHSKAFLWSALGSAKSCLKWAKAFTDPSCFWRPCAPSPVWLSRASKVTQKIYFAFF